ncbi:REP-associated tyrosine transposase [Motilimonas pumila]|uniref:Transposase n=1 Tax=Motilimonas pumila TaxID=2303987 RepID=A0A418YJ09_9GAMM|nr:transposase [Motilimonas pumila]RJG50633.1 transposase [Motilimonas pumila]
MTQRHPTPHYLITLFTADRRPIFSLFKNARIAIRALQLSDAKGASKTVSFVVMPDHLHWLMQPQADVELAKVIASVKQDSASSIQERQNHDLAIWQNTHHSQQLKLSEDIQRVAHLVVNTPSRASLVTDIAFYPHWDNVYLGTTPKNEGDVAKK